MTVETATNPVAGAPAAPAPEVADDERFFNSVSSESTHPEEEGIESDGLAGAPDQPEAEAEKGKPAPEETVEIEFGGKKHAIPKDLREAFLMQADYTRKTQTVAEAARQVDAAREAFEAERTSALAAVEAEKEAHGKVFALRSQLAQWQNVNWDYLEAQDRENNTNELASAMRKYSFLKDTLATAEGELQTKVSERQGKEQADVQRRAAEEAAADAQLVSQGYQHLVSKIPDWREVAPKVVSFGSERFGFSPQEIAAVRDPRMFEVLHLAYLGAQKVAQAQQTERIQRAQQVTPVPTIPARAPPVKDRDRTNTEEWMRLRAKDLAAKRTRR